MADNATGLNAQYDPGTSKFFAAVPDGTGAPGSPGAQDSPPGIGGGAVIASPVVSAPYGSSQLPENMVRLPVTQGDTSSFSDDMAAHPVPGVAGAEGYLATGAGQGSVAGPHHPNSMAGGA